ncbi:hypothetical protein PSCICJ_04320 [Pseudomonas cichorii]|nr:hypothetical protein PSCICJ_04320 [Pseudomonas cichorii]
MLKQQTGKMFTGQQHILIHQHHAAAIEQRGPDFQGAGIEGRVGGKGHTVRGIEVGITVIDDQTADCAMGHQYTLGCTGRTGGVHDIGRCAAFHCHLRCRIRLTVQLQGIELQAKNVRQRLATAQAQQHACLTVLKHELLTLGGRIDVQRHIHGTALENRQLADQQLERTLKLDCDSITGLDASSTQMPGHCVGTGIQLAVTELLLAMYGRRRVGMAFGMCFEKCRYAAVSRIGPRRVVECHK